MTRRKPRDGWHEKECLVLLGRITWRKPPSSSYWRLNRRPLGSVMWDSWNRYLTVRHYLRETNTHSAFVWVHVQFFHVVYDRDTSTQSWHTNVAFSSSAHLLKPHIIHKLSLLSSSHQILGVCTPQHSKFWPFFITNFKTNVSTFCDWFQLGWAHMPGESASPTLSASQALSFIMWNWQLSYLLKWESPSITYYLLFTWNLYFIQLNFNNLILFEVTCLCIAIT